jgi:hypothetical protein
MWPVPVVVQFVFTQSVQQVRLVPDQCPVEQFMGAGLDSSLHDRVHPGRRPDTAEHHGDAGVGEDGIEQRRVLPIPEPYSGPFLMVGELLRGGDNA